MKLCHLLCGIFCLLFLLLANADDTAGVPLKVEGIKGSYPASAAITVKVSNVTQGLVVYGLGIQMQTSEGWRDFMTNIDDPAPDHMEFKLRKIGAGKTQTLTWQPKLVPKMYGPINGTYRVYFIWNADPSDHKKFYSVPFKIEE
jgi:hypothetical protein